MEWLGKEGSMNIDDPRIQLPAVVAHNEKTVRGRFWPKIRRSVAQIPFAPDLLAAYFCAMDPQTPPKVKAVLLGALAYFVLPTDIIPDFIAGLGFTDDLTVLLTAIAIVRGHLTPLHQEKAASHLHRLKDGTV